MSSTVHVRGRRPNGAELANEVFDVAKALPLFATSPLLRRWHQRWGASDAEVAAEMPGDALVPDAQYSVTRAISIGVPPERVWPWLAQVGFGKAGFYSNDLLDNVGHPSAEYLMKEFQHPQLGDWVPMFSKVNDTTAFKVVDADEPHHLLWLKPDSTWEWQLTPSEEGGTRLVTRLRIRYRWDRPAEAAFSLVLNEFGDFPMMRRMLLNLRERAEGF
jgi:hypothetical protein